MSDQAAEQERQAIIEKVNKLKNSKFKQQTLPAWRPVPSFGSTMLTFLIFGVVFLVLGVVLYVMSEEIVEVTKRYDDTCGNEPLCTVKIKVDEEIPQPIYVYYQLNNFYQNHRRYVKSRDNEQLRGVYKDVEALDECDPIKTVDSL